MTQNALPQPPVPADLDLRHFDYMPLDVRALRDSDMQLEVTPEEGWYAVQIWGAAWHQIPASSLPNDEAKLMYLAGLGRDARTWKRLRSGVLRGFTLHSDGRLYHKRLSIIAMESWTKSRAGKRGAQARWQGINTLENNDTQNATAPIPPLSTANGEYGVVPHAEPDRTPRGKRMPRREGIYPSPKGVSFSAGSTTGQEDPSTRPPVRSLPERSRLHGGIQRDGRVCVHYPRHAPDGNPERFLRISPSGIVDVVDQRRHLPDLTFTTEDALALRANALAFAAGEPPVALEPPGDYHPAPVESATPPRAERKSSTRDTGDEIVF